MFEVYNKSTLSTIYTNVDENESIYYTLNSIANDVKNLENISLIKYTSYGPPLGTNKKIVNEFFFNKEMKCFFDSLTTTYLSIPSSSEYRYLMKKIKSELLKNKRNTSINSRVERKIERNFEKKEYDNSKRNSIQSNKFNSLNIGAERKEKKSQKFENVIPIFEKKNSAFDSDIPKFEREMKKIDDEILRNETDDYVIKRKDFKPVNENNKSFFGNLGEAYKKPADLYSSPPSPYSSSYSMSNV